MRRPSEVEICHKPCYDTAWVVDNTTGCVYKCLQSLTLQYHAKNAQIQTTKGKFWFFWVITQHVVFLGRRFETSVSSV